MKKVRIRAKSNVTIRNIPVLYMREGEAFVCYSPALDLAAHGDSFEDAEKSFSLTLKLFVEEVTKLGTWNKVLQECGWEKVKNEWTPPVLIGQHSLPVSIPA